MNKFLQGYSYWLSSLIWGVMLIVLFLPFSFFVFAKSASTIVQKPEDIILASLKSDQYQRDFSTKSSFYVFSPSFEKQLKKRGVALKDYFEYMQLMNKLFYSQGLGGVPPEKVVKIMVDKRMKLSSYTAVFYTVYAQGEKGDIIPAEQHVAFLLQTKMGWRIDVEPTTFPMRLQKGKEQCLLDNAPCRLSTITGTLENKDFYDSLRNYRALAKRAFAPIPPPEPLKINLTFKNEVAQVTKRAVIQTKPYIVGDFILWYEYEPTKSFIGHLWNLYLFNRKTGTVERVTDLAQSKEKFLKSYALTSDSVFWVVDQTLFEYTIATKQTRSLMPGIATVLGASEQFLLLRKSYLLNAQGLDFPGTVFLYRRSDNQRVTLYEGTTDGEHARLIVPFILDGGRAVWLDPVTGHFQLYDTATGTTDTVAPEQGFIVGPYTSFLFAGDHIVWLNRNTDPATLAVYSLSEQRVVFSLSLSQKVAPQLLSFYWPWLAYRAFMEQGGKDKLVLLHLATKESEIVVKNVGVGGADVGENVLVWADDRNEKEEAGIKIEENSDIFVKLLK